MSATITNQIASPALRGQDAVVSFTTAAAISTIKNLVIGGTAQVGSSSKLGTISEIDTEGLTVKVKPAQPDRSFDSTSTPGILAANDTVTFTY